MTLDRFNTNEIQRRISKIEEVLDIDMSFERDLRLHNELFVLKALIDSWEFNTELRIRDWEQKA